MERSEYMHLKLSNLPKSVLLQYNIEARATRDGYVHVDIWRGMYGLPQAGIIAQKLLYIFLNKQGYQTHYASMILAYNILKKNTQSTSW